MKETKKSGEVGMIPTKTLREISEEAYKICSECKITDSCEKTDCIVNVRQFVSVDVLQQKLQARIKSLQEWTKFDSNPQSTGYLRAFSQIDILKELLVELEQKEARP